MTEKFKESTHKGNAFGTLLSDFSKAFDYIDHILLIAKLSAFGVSSLSLKLLYSYLSNRTKRIKTTILVVELIRNFVYLRVLF